MSYMFVIMQINSKIENFTYEANYFRGISTDRKASLVLINAAGFSSSNSTLEKLEDIIPEQQKQQTGYVLTYCEGISWKNSYFKNEQNARKGFTFSSSNFFLISFYQSAKGV